MIRETAKAPLRPIVGVMGVRALPEGGNCGTDVIASAIQTLSPASLSERDYTLAGL